METIKITSKEYITEGGCNACGPINYKNYVLHFEDGKSMTAEGLEVAALVMTLAQKKGWRTELNFDSEEDVILFTKDARQVALNEGYNQIMLTYQANGQTIKTKNSLAETEVLAKAQQIFQELFQEAPVTFELSEA